MDPDKVTQLKEFGAFVAETLPTYVEKVHIESGDELVIAIVPEGIVPMMKFLKEHPNAQFTNLSDITAVDYPSRPQRFEVHKKHFFNIYILFKTL